VVDEAVADPDEFDAELDEMGPAPSKFSGKKIVLFIVLPVLLLGGIGAGVMFSGLLDSAPENKAAAHGAPAAAHGAAPADGHAAAPPALKTVFYDLPEMLVNLNTKGRRPTYLKIKVSLEVANEPAAKQLAALRPRIIDHFQVYLRELRVDDLRGSAGIYRLREELLARVNSAVKPTKVENVLFREVLVQ
jgi:flagellar protein FliL